MQLSMLLPIFYLLKVREYIFAIVFPLTGFIKMGSIYIIAKLRINVNEYNINKISKKILYWLFMYY